MMSNKKIFVTSLNKLNSYEKTDGWCDHNIIKYGGFKYLATTVDNVNDADFIIYIRHFGENEFSFDEELANIILNLNKKIIVFDYVEYKSESIFTDEYLYDYDILGYKITGVLLKKFILTKKDDYNNIINYFLKFRDNNLIFCYFKRELSKFIDTSDSSFPIYPSDYFNYLYSSPYNQLYIDDYSEEYFNNKPIDMFYTWGLSTLDRPKLNGKFLLEFENLEINKNTSEMLRVVNTSNQLENRLELKIKNLIFISRIEWLERLDYKKYLLLSKTVIDLYGAGMKCFRNFESALDSVSFKQDPSLLLHAYQWENGKNCIFLPNKDHNRLDINLSYDIIHDYIRNNQNKLYNIFKESKLTAKKYTNEEYTKNYIFPKIKNLFV